MRYEYSSSECGIVYKQILISAILQMGRRGKKNRADWEKYIKEAGVRKGLQCHLRRRSQRTAVPSEEKFAKDCSAI
jgi:hypothetical protein